MTKPKTIVPEEILIRQFKLIDGQIHSPLSFRMENIESFVSDTKLTTGINLDEKLIRADITFHVATVSKEAGEEATAAYTFIFLYYYEDLLNQTSQQEDGAIAWNPYLSNAIVSITYSTSRGVLLSRFQGTVLQDFILPVVDPKTLLNSSE